MILKESQKSDPNATVKIFSRTLVIFRGIIFEL